MASTNQHHSNDSWGSELGNGVSGLDGLCGAIALREQALDQFPQAIGRATIHAATTRDWNDFMRLKFSADWPSRYYIFRMSDDS